MLPCYCIHDSLSFDLQHDHVLKKLRFDLYTPTPGSGDGGGLQEKCLRPSFCIPDSLKFDMQHEIVLKKLNFDLLAPRVSVGVLAKYLLPCAKFRDCINLICNANMFSKS